MADRALIAQLIAHVSESSVILLPNLLKLSSTNSDKPISRQNDGIQPE